MSLGRVVHNEYDTLKTDTSENEPAKAQSLVMSFRQARERINDDSGLIRLEKQRIPSERTRLEQDWTVLSLSTVYGEVAEHTYGNISGTVANRRLAVPFNYDEVDTLLGMARRTDAAVDFRPSNNMALRSQVNLWKL